MSEAEKEIARRQTAALYEQLRQISPPGKLFLEMFGDGGRGPDPSVIEMCNFSVLSIGSRGEFTASRCVAAARAFKRLVAINPKVKVILHVGGYDEEPREIYQFADAAQYIRQWAELAGLTTLEDAMRWLDYEGGLPLVVGAGCYDDATHTKAGSETA